MAWYKDNSDGTTHPVATKQPNAWGLYDMHGNVWQWCLDHWTYRLPGGAITDPVLGPGGGGVHALRGGGWNSEVVECRFASRTYNGGPGGGLLWVRSYVGFRVALVPIKS
jgi:formylglycine-generating enzyme required for sulfatase activity